MRHLHDHRVFDPRLRIEPEVRCNLPAARKRQQHVIRYILCREPDLLRLEPVHFDVELRGIDFLLHEYVYCSRNILDLLLQRFCNLRCRHSVFSAHLHIDRRGQPKVQSLIRDVRGLKEKCFLGKLLREVLPQNLHPFLRRPVLGGEQHQHIPIPVAGRITRRVGQVYASWRQPDVVQHHLKLLRRDHAPNFLVYLLEHLGCGFDARACRWPYMKLHLPGIHIREKVTANHRNQCQRTQGDHREHNQRYLWMPQRPLQSALVLLRKPVESTFEPLVKAPDEASAQR